MSSAECLEAELYPDLEVSYDYPVEDDSFADGPRDKLDRKELWEAFVALSTGHDICSSSLSAIAESAREMEFFSAMCEAKINALPWIYETHMLEPGLRQIVAEAPRDGETRQERDSRLEKYIGAMADHAESRLLGDDISCHYASMIACAQEYAGLMKRMRDSYHAKDRDNYIDAYSRAVALIFECDRRYRHCDELHDRFRRKICEEDDALRSLYKTKP